MRLFNAVWAVPVLVATTGLGLAGQAHTPASPTHSGLHQRHEPRSAALSSGSSNWAGYVAGDNHKTVVTTWVNPDVDCSTKGIVSWWDGIDGWDSKTVEQIGVDADCTSGKLEYNPWYELYPQDSVYFKEKTKVGDTMTATTTYNGNHKYTMTLADTTQKWSKTFDGKASGDQHVDAEVIVEAIGDSEDIPPCPNFGTISFTKSTVDGKPLDGDNPTKTELERNGTQLTDTGSLSGGAFSMKWKHA